VRSAGIDVNVFAIEHLQQGDSLDRVTGDDRYRHEWQHRGVTMGAASVLDELRHQNAVAEHVAEVQPQRQAGRALSLRPPTCHHVLGSRCVAGLFKRDDPGTASTPHALIHHHHHGCIRGNDD
jgi:hypothetical protein